MLFALETWFGLPAAVRNIIPEISTMTGARTMATLKRKLRILSKISVSPAFPSGLQMHVWPVGDSRSVVPGSLNALQ